MQFSHVLEVSGNSDTTKNLTSQNLSLKTGKQIPSSLANRKKSKLTCKRDEMKPKQSMGNIMQETSRDILGEDSLSLYIIYLVLYIQCHCKARNIQLLWIQALGGLVQKIKKKPKKTQGFFILFLVRTRGNILSKPPNHSDCSLVIHFNRTELKKIPLK